MQFPVGTSILGSLVGVAAITVWRIREGRTPVSARQIIIPPLGMATGFSMFLLPGFRIPWSWAALSFLIGAIGLAYPLLRTSRLVRQGDAVMMQRSGAFLGVILVLAAVRIAAHGYFDTILSVQQTASLFFLLAFGMIARWRAQMLFEYRSLTSPSRS